jgi:putative CocE/NonD family hydrolase
MSKRIRCPFLLTIAIVLAVPPATAQDETLEELERKLESVASVDKLLMVPMRDGTRLATNVYRPGAADGRVPTIFHRTPYNFNRLSKSTLKTVLEALERGYAYVIQNERGKFFSEGEWEILGRPRSDGYDALTWIAEQPWSDGKVGTIGCSSSAEWQLALAATNHPAHTAMIPMAPGDGIGRVGPFYEQGNWYRGGATQLTYISWLYGVQNTQRPTLPSGLDREDRSRLSRYFDLAPKMPDVDWAKAFQHLPVIEIMEQVEGPEGMFAEFATRTPDDPAWYEGGLYHDDEPFGTPSLWINSWYDISIGQNLALYNHVRATAEDPEVAENQYVVIAPTAHCGFFRAKEETIVGARNLGDARLDEYPLIFGWFDFWLKGEDNGFTRDTPKVQYYTMGLNKWQSAKSWPPQGVETLTYYLTSDGAANSLFGDGELTPQKPSKAESSDTFPYDPQTPVPSVGGGVCCVGDAMQAGAFDQRGVEARHDVLVYSSDVLAEGIEVSGWIEVTLYVSSDAKDTDFTVKLVDVGPDGTAYNIVNSIQRVRYREGYDKQVFMKVGEVYEIRLGPMTTSNYFAAGHRVRIEVSSSNFPYFARNLNTGGNNYDETESVAARNSVHHSRDYPSSIRLPIVKR